MASPCCSFHPLLHGFLTSFRFHSSTSFPLPPLYDRNQPSCQGCWWPQIGSIPCQWQSFSTFLNWNTILLESCNYKVLFVSLSGVGKPYLCVNRSFKGDLNAWEGFRCWLFLLVLTLKTKRETNPSPVVLRIRGQTEKSVGSSCSYDLPTCWETRWRARLYKTCGQTDVRTVASAPTNLTSSLDVNRYLLPHIICICKNVRSFACSSAEKMWELSRTSCRR